MIRRRGGYQPLADMEQLRRAAESRLYDIADKLLLSVETGVILRLHNTI